MAPKVGIDLTLATCAARLSARTNKYTVHLLAVKVGVGAGNTRKTEQYKNDFGDVPKQWKTAQIKV